MTIHWQELRGVVWDWGDTLMRDIPGQPGPMAGWPVVEAMPGAAAALRALAHLPVQVQRVGTNATESDGAQVALALERVGLRGHLTHFVTSRELGIGKPDPAFFARVAEEVGLPASDLLSIGNDLDKDIVPAKTAGLATVWVNLDGSTARHSAADLVVHGLARLAEVVAGRRVPRR